MFLPDLLFFREQTSDCCDTKSCPPTRKKVAEVFTLVYRSLRRCVPSPVTGLQAGFELKSHFFFQSQKYFLRKKGKEREPTQPRARRINTISFTTLFKTKAKKSSKTQRRAYVDASCSFPHLLFFFFRERTSDCCNTKSCPSVLEKVVWVFFFRGGVCPLCASPKAFQTQVPTRKRERPEQNQARGRDTDTTPFRSLQKQKPHNTE